METNKIQFNLSPKALDFWKPGLSIKADAGANTINIFDAIGEDYWTGGGVTPKSISQALSGFDGEDVIVNINSPGGSMFDGLAIHSLLRAHTGKVTVRVLGIAASAASLIAMAGDEIQIAKSGFLMIHNAWVYVAGNRNDLRDTADYLETFDKSMTLIYADRTGIKSSDLSTMMDAETYLSGSESVAQGFADALLEADVSSSGNNEQARAAAILDTALAKAGVPRSERRKLLNEIKTSTRNATGDGTQNATEKDPATGIAAVLSSNLLGVLK